MVWMKLSHNGPANWSRPQVVTCRTLSASPSASCACSTTRRPTSLGLTKPLPRSNNWTPNARFDQYLKGDKKAISKDELAGYQLFKESGCVACHNGPAVGGN